MKKVPKFVISRQIKQLVSLLPVETNGKLNGGRSLHADQSNNSQKETTIEKMYQLDNQCKSTKSSKNWIKLFHKFCVMRFITLE